MMLLRRRDTTILCATVALVGGIPAAMLMHDFGHFHRQGSAAGGLLAAVLAAASVAIISRRLPPDVPLRPLPSAAGWEVLQADPPADRMRLRIAMAPEFFSCYRLDLFIDAIRTGQLGPGMVLVTNVTPGEHTFSAHYGFRALGAGHTVNAIAGMSLDLVIRGSSGSRKKQFALEHANVEDLMTSGRMVVVERTSDLPNRKIKYAKSAGVP